MDERGELTSALRVLWCLVGQRFVARVRLVKWLSSECAAACFGTAARSSTVPKLAYAIEPRPMQRRPTREPQVRLTVEIGHSLPVTRSTEAGR